MLAATDPANPYGAALAVARAARGDVASRPPPGRKAGALVVLVDGALVLYVERGGRTLLSWSDDAERAGRGHRGARRRRTPRPAGRLTVQKADGTSVLAPASALGAALEAGGFTATPQGLRLRP